MTEKFDFIVVGGGSAGAVIAARLTEDGGCRVVLLEAGERPPEMERMPVAAAMMKLNPATDWMYTGDSGRAGQGLPGRRMRLPRGKMLGGSSGLNYMAYVRGHPGDYDAWAAKGARGWSYEEVLPYFRKSEGLEASEEIVIDAEAHGTTGPMGVSVRSPILPGARDFVAAAEAAGIPRGDYNGRQRGGAAGVVSLLQTTTRRGQRASTYRAFLEGGAEQRPNLTILTGVLATRVVMEGGKARGVAYRTGSGEERTVWADKEVIVCGGAIGSAQLLLLSGVGPRRELEAVGVECIVDSPHVGKHLKDHIMLALLYAAPEGGLSLGEVGMAMGPDALRQPRGPLPADPSEDEGLPGELQGLKQEALRQLMEWATTGNGVASSSLYDASAWYSTGLGDEHSHDAQIGFLPFGFMPDFYRGCLNIDVEQYFADVERQLSPMARNVVLLANPVLPRSEGEIVLESGEAGVHPVIRMNYFGEEHDLRVMVAVVRRALEIVAQWPAERRLGPLHVPPVLASKHGYREGDELSDALIEDWALHFATTVYHQACTCRMGDVVDERLRVKGVEGLRVADASVMPDLISGNTNAAVILIGEKAAEMIAADHGVGLAEFVGEK